VLGSLLVGAVAGVVSSNEEEGTGNIGVMRNRKEDQVVWC